MVKFSGIISKSIQKRAARGRKIKRLILVLILNLLTLAIAVALAFKFPKYCDVILTIWGGAVCFESLPSLFVPCKPQRVNVFISDAEVYYHNLEINEENRIDILEIDRVIDYGYFYVLKYEKGTKEIICIKEHLIEGTLEEFESLFEEILVHKKTVFAQKGT